ncbi:fibronectin type III-like domain-contianing protein [Streptodolium elevatio]
MFPFGHGLTYTEFAYGDAVADAAEVRAGENLSVRVDITNTGDRLAEEVVQLYARDVVASTVRPVRQLLAFARAQVPAGETRRVRLSAPVNALALIDPADRLVVEPGTIDLMVGSSSADVRARTSVVVTGETAEIPRAGRFLGNSEEIRPH